MSCCQPCASADGVLIVSVRLLEYLCCLCGRLVACLTECNRMLIASCYILLNYNTINTIQYNKLGRPIRRWLDNIRMDLVEVGWGDVDWIVLA
jgi:hypothetical protein